MLVLGCNSFALDMKMDFGRKKRKGGSMRCMWPKVEITSKMVSIHVELGFQVKISIFLIVILMTRNMCEL